MRRTNRLTRVAVATTAAGVLTAGLAVAPASATSSQSFIAKFHQTTTIASTVPANGDVNPYGTAVVQRSQGRLVQGNVLISNFNNSKNIQGTGTTIVQVSPHGTVTQFARINPRRLPSPCPGGIGLTTALEILNGGWVVVGSLPTSHGGTVFAGSGCLLVLNSGGKVVETFTGHGLNGPWDMTDVQAGSSATLFVSNVLNGTAAAGGQVVHRGTVIRLALAQPGGSPPRIVGATKVGSGFPQRTDPAALVIGPTGLGIGTNGTLYVADTLSSRIAAIPDALMRSTSAGRGVTVSQGGALNGPLGLAMAPNDHILTVNAGDGNIVETTPSGRQVATMTLDSSGSPPGAGALFGLAVAPGGSGVYYVDDAANTLNLLH
jgi:hypothetical protein